MAAIAEHDAGPFRLPASFLQEEIFDAFDPAGNTFAIPSVWRLLGPLDVGALQCALDALAERHETLRTTLVRGRNGVEQLVWPAQGLTLEQRDVSTPRDRRRFTRLLQHDSVRPFDLRGGPLARATLYRLGAFDHVLQLDVHHAFSDGWSTRLLLRDCVRLYEATVRRQRPRLPALPMQFGDYAAWERARRDPEREAFWRAQLAHAPAPLRFPGEVQGMERTPFGLGTHELPTLGPRVVGSLARLAEACGASAGGMVRAATIAALVPFAGDEIVVGVLYANRGRAELQPVVGFACDYLPLRVDLSGEPSFAELLARTTAAWSDAVAHAMPFGAIRSLAAGERTDGGRPFEVTINYTPHAPPPSYELKAPGGGRLIVRELVGRQVRTVRVLHEWTVFTRLGFIFGGDASGGMRGWLIPNSGALPDAVAHDLGRSFAATLRRCALDPHAPIRSASIARA